MVRKYIGMVTALLMVTFGGNAFAEDDSEVIERFRKAGAGELIDAAYGYAVFPTIGKGGIGIGGAHGSGRVYKGKNKLMGENYLWSKRNWRFMSLSSSCSNCYDCSGCWSGWSRWHA